MYERYTKAASKFLSEAFDDEDLTAVEELPEEDLEGLDDVEDIEDIDDESEEGIMTCPDCNGEGVITDEDGEEVECETCGGEGTVHAEDMEFDFDPATGICPCCGCKLNVVEGGEETEGEDLEDLEDLDELDDEEIEEDEEDDL